MAKQGVSGLEITKGLSVVDRKCDSLLEYRMRSPLARASSVTRYMANRPGRSVVASGATTVGAAEATIASAAVAKEDRMSLMFMRLGVVVVLDDGKCRFYSCCGDASLYISREAV